MAINLAELEVLIKAIGLDETKAALENIEAAGQQAAEGLGETEEGAKGAADAAIKLAPGLRTVIRNLEQLAFKASGVSPSIGKLILNFAKLHPILIAVTVAVAGLIAVYNLLKPKINEAEDAQRKLNEELAKEFDLRNANTIIGLQDRIRKNDEDLLEIQQKLAQARIDWANAVSMGASAGIVQTKIEENIKKLITDWGIILKANNVLRQDAAKLAKQQFNAEENIAKSLRDSQNRQLADARARIEATRNLTSAHASQIKAQAENLELTIKKTGWDQQAVDNLTILINRHQALLTLAQREAEQSESQQKLLKDRIIAAEDEISNREEDLEIRRRAGKITEENYNKELQLLTGLRQANTFRQDDLIRAIGAQERYNALLADRVILERLATEMRTVLGSEMLRGIVDPMKIPFALEVPHEEIDAFVLEFEESVRSALVEALGTVLEDTFTAAFARGAKVVPAAIKAMAGSILAALGGLMIEQGKALVAYGKIMSALQKFLTNPFTAGPASVAAGLALIALGAAFRGIASNMAGGNLRSTTSGRAFDQSDRSSAGLPDETVRTRIPTGGLELSSRTQTAASGNTFVIIGPNDAQAQDQIVKLLQNAQRRGHVI